jgi:hypothetical protein
MRVPFLWRQASSLGTRPQDAEQLCAVEPTALLLTCTLLIAVPTAEALSIAHPTTVTVACTVAPDIGASMKTVGVAGPPHWSKEIPRAPFPRSP